MSSDFEFEEPSTPAKPVEAPAVEFEKLERPEPKCHYTEPIDRVYLEEMDKALSLAKE